MWVPLCDHQQDTTMSDYNLDIANRLADNTGPTESVATMTEAPFGVM